MLHSAADLTTDIGEIGLSCPYLGVEVSRMSFSSSSTSRKGSNDEVDDEAGELDTLPGLLGLPSRGENWGCIFVCNDPLFDSTACLDFQSFLRIFSISIATMLLNGGKDNIIIFIRESKNQ